MKKAVFLALRLLIAAAGISFIVWKLNWTNQLLFPAEAALPDGQTLLGQVSVPISDESLQRFEAQGHLTVHVPVTQGESAPVTLNWPLEGEQPVPVDFQPSIGRNLAGAAPGWLLAAFLVIGAIYPIQAARWWLLMRARGLKVTPWRAFRLVMVGSFFNFCMPGTTGGDLIKAYYAARNSDRRADAVMSVVFDRVTGLLGLIVLAGVAGLFMLHHEIARTVTITIWIGAAALAVGATVYFSPTLRRRLGLAWLLGKLPGSSLLQKVDEAAVAYGSHPGAVTAATGLSVLNHLVLVLSTAFAAWALGMGHSLGLLLTVVPIVFFTAAVPLTYQGLGVMEGVALVLLMSAGDPGLATENQIVGTFLLARVFQIVYSMGGSVFLLRGDVHLHPQREEAAVEGERMAELGMPVAE